MIGLDWLRMFSHRELETLICGAEHEISVEDLQAHTNYSGGYTADHLTITGIKDIQQILLLLQVYRIYSRSSYYYRYTGYTADHLTITGIQYIQQIILLLQVYRIYSRSSFYYR